MTDGFSRHRRSGAALATFSAFEADLLRSLAAQLVELLLADEPTHSAVDPLEAMLDFSGPTTEPDDPVLARLLPTGYADDDEAAADFRRFTESDLRGHKAGNAQTVIDTLEEAGLGEEPREEEMIDVELDGPAAQAWLKGLTDLRLALAERIGIQNEDEQPWLDLDEDDPQRQVYGIYQWLGYLQETLVEAIWNA